jgi:hypothetical protein
VDNLAYVSDHGGFLLVAQGIGRYDVHSLFTPDRPGAETLQTMHAALNAVFAATDCLELLTTVPIANRAAAALASRGGFTPRFRTSVAWADGERVEADFLGLTIERWALRSALTPILGAWFHDTLTQAKAAHGSTLPAHPDDPIHDRMVGATVLMLRAGNPYKAVEFYSAWARRTGYAPITLLRAHPIIIDVQDAILECHGNEMRVLTCRAH